MCRLAFPALRFPQLAPRSLAAYRRPPRRRSHKFATRYKSREGRPPTARTNVTRERYRRRNSPAMHFMLPLLRSWYAVLRDRALRPLSRAERRFAATPLSCVLGSTAPPPLPFCGSERFTRTRFFTALVHIDVYGDQCIGGREPYTIVHPLFTVTWLHVQLCG